MGMLKVTPLRSDWNPSLAESKTYVCFTTLHCFLIFFCLPPPLAGENTLNTDSNGETVLNDCRMCCNTLQWLFIHIIEGICIFLFSFLFLAFIVYSTIWTYKHVYNTISGFSSIWIFSKMYISIMYKFCIFKNPCSMYIMKKKQFLTPL